MSTKWTDAQLEAIKTKYRSNGESSNVLVGAAAGSGKTAVLVERIIRKLIPEDSSPEVSADRLLVVTFTNAAAREMAERIDSALSAELEAAVLSGDTERRRRIKRQQLLLADSDITTIDSFCMKLIRSEFNSLDIDPDFTIADSARAAMLSEEAMEEVFSELYEAQDEEFIHLLCLYASARSDDGLAKMVRHIHSFTRSMPNPIGWLFAEAEKLKCENGIENAEWFKKSRADCARSLNRALTLCRRGLSMMSGLDEGFPPPEKGEPVFEEWRSYYKAFYSDYTKLTELAAADETEAAALAHNFTFVALSALKTKTEEERAPFKKLREEVKACFGAIKPVLSVSPREAERQSREDIYPAVLSLVRLVERYDRRYMEKKLRRNILEFSDIEQLTARLLAENPEIRAELQSRYDEILMDEYQDTSALQEEIFRLLSNGSNLFMVGDMKQSIYRFRNSDPSIFKEKNDLYDTAPDSPNRKIILSKNFRSRSEVLDSVNAVFTAIMSEQAGELDYDEEQMLYLGNTGYEDINESNKSECCIIGDGSGEEENPDREELSRTELEARFVAAEINRLKAENFRVCGKNGIRPIENRDIVILMSSHKNAADIYISELNAAGIECFAESEGYFERSEVRLMVSLLKVINNPLCDIPILGILRSPVASFTDDELALIRGCSGGRFFTALKELVRRKNDCEITDPELLAAAEHAAEFCESLSRWRSYARYMPADKLIWTLYEETDFYAFAGAMYDGEEAQANLRLLFERARQYENNGFQGLFSFIKYIDNMKRRESDLSSAKLVGEGHNVVRIMTIHKSKGLEFPVVFLTGGSKRFNIKQDEPRLLLHRKYGIAAEYIDFENGYHCETPAKTFLKSVASAEQLSEEIRKLYVALTRAREKLYFVAAVKTPEDGLSEYVTEMASRIDKDGKMPPQDVLSANGFAALVVPAAAVTDSWLVRTIEASALSAPSAPHTDNAAASEHNIDIEYILDFEYKYREAAALPSKISVSEIKAKNTTPINPMPEFLKEKRADGAYYGTAMHTVLEHLSPAENMDEEYISAALAEMLEGGILTEAEYKMISPKRILDFYRTDIGRRIIAAGEVYREQSFEVAVPAEYLFPEQKNTAGEEVLLQGIIDCYFVENGELVLVDYKTDSYTDPVEIHEKYDIQLKLYQYALEKITGLKVKEKFIYLFFDNSVI